MARLPTTRPAGSGRAAPIRGIAAIRRSHPSGLGPVTARSSWSWVIRHALCRYVSLDPDQWFPASAEAEPARHEAAAAIAICHGCPVRAQCLAVSLRYWDIGQHGVWGAWSRPSARPCGASAGQLSDSRNPGAPQWAQTDCSMPGTRCPEPARA